MFEFSRKCCPILCGIGLGLGIASPALASCGATNSLLNTEWITQGGWLEQGLSADLRVDYTNQGKLKSGVHNVPPQSSGPLSERELDTSTLRATARLDWGIGDGWSVGVEVPMMNREHSHREAITGDEVTWKFTQLGDVALHAGRQTGLASDDPNYANAAGWITTLKLPTGSHTVNNSSNTRAERSLQPGTGSTDVRLGAYFRQINLETNFSWFVQGAVQSPVATKDNYTPGTGTYIDAGVSWAKSPTFSWLLQANFLNASRDRGAEAEPENSGGQFVFLNPGINFQIAEGWRAYGFVQVPVYSNVNGQQLVPRYGLTAGLQKSF